MIVKTLLILLSVWAIPLILFTWRWFGGRISDRGSLMDVAHALICIVWTLIMLGVGFGFLIAG